MADFPRESSDSQNLRSLQEQVRRLRTRSDGAPGPWVPITDNIGPGFSESTAEPVAYRIDRERVYLRGVVNCDTDGSRDLLVGLDDLEISPAYPSDTFLFVPILHNHMGLTDSAVINGFTVSFDFPPAGSTMTLDQADLKLVDFTTDPITYKSSSPAHSGYASNGDNLSLSTLWWWLT